MLLLNTTESENYGDAKQNNLFLSTSQRGRLFCQVKKSGFNKGLMLSWFLQSLALSQRHCGVGLSVSPGGPVPSKGELYECLLWPFADATPFRN